MMRDDHLIIFDFDGVIVNTLELCVDISKRLNPHVSREEYLSHFEGNIYEAVRSEKLKDHQTDAAGTTHRWFDIYSEGMASHSPEEAMPHIIAEFGSTYPMVIVSSSQSDLIRTFLETNNLSQYFKAVLGSDVHTSKVVKIRTALQQNTILARNAIMITDTLGDIREAEQCNVAAIGVTWGYHPRETLEKGSPFAIATEPNDIPKIIERYFVAGLEKE